MKFILKPSERLSLWLILIISALFLISLVEGFDLKTVIVLICGFLGIVYLQSIKLVVTDTSVSFEKLFELIRKKKQLLPIDQIRSVHIGPGGFGYRGNLVIFIDGKNVRIQFRHFLFSVQSLQTLFRHIQAKNPNIFFDERAIERTVKIA